MPVALPFLATILAAGLADASGWGHFGATWFAALVFFGLVLLPERAWRLFVDGLLVLSGVVALLAIAQLAHIARATGPFPSPNVLGAYATVHLFMALRAGRHGIALLDLLATLASQSRGAMLSAGAGGMVLLWRRSRPLALAALLAGVMAVLLTRPGIEEARLGIWRAAALAALQRPLLGWGQGGLWIANLGSFYSVPLQWAVETGIVGLAAAAWLAVAAWRQADHPALRALLAAWLVQGLFLYLAPATALPLLVALAALARAEGITPKAS